MWEDRLSPIQPDVATKSATLNHTVVGVYALGQRRPRGPCVTNGQPILSIV